MKVYKLTDRDGRTHGETQWGPGVTHEAPGEGELCTAGWLHCYSDPLLAVLLDPIGADFGDGRRLWLAEADGRTLDDHGLKMGVQRLTTIEELTVTVVTTEQAVRFGILCAREVYKEPSWTEWAEAWLSGKDRSWSAAAAEAAEAAEAAAEAAWLAAAAAAAEAAAEAGIKLDLAAIAREAMRANG